MKPLVALAAAASALSAVNATPFSNWNATAKQVGNLQTGTLFSIQQQAYHTRTHRAEYLTITMGKKSSRKSSRQHSRQDSVTSTAGSVGFTTGMNTGISTKQPQTVLLDSAPAPWTRPVTRGRMVPFTGLRFHASAISTAIHLIILLLFTGGSLKVLLDYLLLATRADAQCVPSTTTATIFVPFTETETVTASTSSSPAYTTMSTTTVSITNTVTVTASESILGFVITSGTTSWIGPSPSSGVSIVYAGVTTVTIAPLPSSAATPTEIEPPPSTSHTTVTSTSTITKFTTVTPTVTVPTYSSTLYRFLTPDVTTTLTSTRYLTVSLLAVPPRSSFTGINSGGWNSTADAQSAGPEPTTVTFSETFFQGINATTSTITSFLTTTIGATVTQTISAPAFVTTASGAAGSEPITSTVQPTAITQTILVQPTEISVGGASQTTSTVSAAALSSSNAVGMPPPAYSQPESQVSAISPDLTVTSFVAGHGTTFTIESVPSGSTPFSFVNSSLVSIISTFYEKTLPPGSSAQPSTLSSGPGSTNRGSAEASDATLTVSTVSKLGITMTSTISVAEPSTVTTKGPSTGDDQGAHSRSSSKTSSSLPSPASPTAQPSSTACGEQGDFTMTFDDISTWGRRIRRQSNHTNTTRPDITSYPPINLHGPYHHMLFSTGYVFAPNPVEPFQPASPPNVAAFADPFKARTPTNTPNTIEPGEFAEYDADNSTFFFDPLDAAVGCDSPSHDCTLETTGYAWDPAIKDESPVQQHNYTLPLCQVRLVMADEQSSVSSKRDVDRFQRGFLFTSVNLRTQKRLAASVADCGKRKIWLDPNEVNEISNANSRQTIRKLIADGLIIKKPVTMHSRARARELTAARRIGRHRGFGKRKGTADARMPTQVMWMRRLRVLRRLLVKYRAAGKIDKHLYHELYHLSKGNTFKHKRALVEHIHKAKAEKQREERLKAEMDAKRAKTKAARERRQERVQAKRQALTGEDEPEAQ
ncbi:60s ribosomal l19 [Lecanosticta acicola]|uniref:Ribosomal protein L19 n=1 Tax=Lecanosticta acicola TaxID=111012 RepID=A0AAI8Z6B6_9PEZI|nr:60s ribosomal l19 [Lecanosticta acicola]